MIYSNLNLAPGESGRYICNAGYALHSFQDRYEFVCTEDGVWDGNVTEAPIECLCKQNILNLCFKCNSGSVSHSHTCKIGDLLVVSEYEVVPL